MSSLRIHKSKGFSIISLKSFSNFPATAPSNTLWSADKVDLRIFIIFISSFTTPGIFLIVPTAKIEDCGGLIIAETL